MKERPILFSGPMVRAILAGTKTQTRRVVKITHRTPGLAACLQPPVGGPRPRAAAELCPYGQPGDRLWVRETWGVGTRPDPHEGWRVGIEYRADDFGLDEHDLLPLHQISPPDDVDLDSYRGGWKPSIHMPRWASRITLEITGMRVERLQDISYDDCWAEGIQECDGMLDDMEICRLAREMGRSFEDPQPTYAALWESINGTGSWAANPWVWVVEFRRVEP